MIYRQVVSLSAGSHMWRRQQNDEVSECHHWPACNHWPVILTWTTNQLSWTNPQHVKHYAQKLCSLVVVSLTVTGKHQTRWQLTVAVEQKSIHNFTPGNSGTSSTSASAALSHASSSAFCNITIHNHQFDNSLIFQQQWQMLQDTWCNKYYKQLTVWLTIKVLCCTHTLISYHVMLWT